LELVELIGAEVFNFLDGTGEHLDLMSFVIFEYIFIFRVGGGRIVVVEEGDFIETHCRSVNAVEVGLFGDTFFESRVGEDLASDLIELGDCHAEGFDGLGGCEEEGGFGLLFRLFQDFFRGGWYWLFGWWCFDCGIHVSSSFFGTAFVVVVACLTRSLFVNLFGTCHICIANPS